MEPIIPAFTPAATALAPAAIHEKGPFNPPL